MRHDPRLAAAVAPRLDTGIREVQLLNSLYFDVKRAQSLAHDIRRFRTSGILLPAPGVEPVRPEQGGKLSFPTFALIA